MQMSRCLPRIPASGILLNSLKILDFAGIGSLEILSLPQVLYRICCSQLQSQNESLCYQFQARALVLHWYQIYDSFPDNQRFSKLPDRYPASRVLSCPEHFVCASPQRIPKFLLFGPAIQIWATQCDTTDQMNYISLLQTTCLKSTQLPFRFYCKKNGAIWGSYQMSLLISRF